LPEVDTPREVKYLDPRVAIIRHRVEHVGNVVAIASGKGGVGKTTLATLSALVLSKRGLRVGLLDLDFNCPACHIVLGAQDAKPREEYGLVPPKVYGVEFMSIAMFVGDKEVPMRGVDIVNAMIEILAITRWSKLDLLLIDLPPGTSDEVLEVARLLKHKLKTILVTTPSRLSIAGVRKLWEVLKKLNVPTLGLVINMVRNINEIKAVEEEVRKWGIENVATLPYDSELENAIGSPDKLLNTEVAREIRRFWDKVLEVMMAPQQRTPG